MKFITLRSSATGKKFTDIEKKKAEAHKALDKLGKELGFKQFRHGYWTAFGGISAILFPDKVKVDKKVWREVDRGEWMPRANIKAGKEIMAKIKALPSVGIEELNRCIGFDESFKCIGVDFNNKKYISFDIQDEWGIKIPKDCKEVTVTSYRTLFGRKPSKIRNN